ILYAYDLTPFQTRTSLQTPIQGAKNHQLRRFGADGLAMTNDRELTLIRSDEVFGIHQYGVLRNDGATHTNAHPTIVDDVDHGSLQMHPDGTFDYRPDADYVGVDQFRYRVTDTNGVASTALVTINVTPRNDAPTAVGDVYTMSTVAPLSIDVNSSVLANDTDIDGDALSAILVNPPQHGTVTLRPDGSFVYLPDNTFTVSDTFTYQARDAATTSAPQSVTIRLDVPVISVGHYNLRPNTPNQRIELFVTGGHRVSGLDLYALIGDGGPERELLGLSAGEDGPAITAVELKQNTIFAALPDVPTNLQSLPQIANWSIAASENGSTAVADGLLATLVIDTTGFFDGDWSLSLTGVLPEHPLGPFQTRFADSLAFVTNGTISVVPTQVLSRQVFYNHSAWDGNDANASPADDLAVATDKRALLPGQTATFVNYTSYNRGINGVQLDLLGVPDTVTLTAADFTFRMGRSENAAAWPAAPAPSVQTRRGAGVNGSDRVTLIWPDDAIRNTWLQVTLKAGARTWLAHDDVFYFGNALGETGSTPGNTLVTSIDIIAARDHQRGPFDLAPIDDPYDFNRDRLVSSIDVILARDNQVGLLMALPLISPSEAPASLAARSVTLVPGDVNADGVFDSADLWIVFQAGEYDDSIAQNSDWASGDWNADGEFDSSDLILALQAGYSETPRATSASDLAAAVDDLFATGTSRRRSTD
ncbi:MAG: tandem-95 repeat protein, partial [Planctomycetales bacterium]|nr:tandem-95 repeat protein [Planctomycetales bacterium]